jgi:predicted DNA binding protein
MEEVTYIDKMEILSVLKSENGKHTCLVKHEEPEGSQDAFQEYDLDLIYSQPFIISPDKNTFSVIGEHKNLLRFIELMKMQASKVINMTFKRAAYQRQDILTVLTEKQKEIIIAAHKYGYYDYPKKISSEKLASRVNISKGTMMEHLRKAEGRLLDEILTGYS